MRSFNPHPDPAAQFKRIGYGVVRDGTTGKVKVDGDPKDMDPMVAAHMKRADRADLGLWPHDFMVDSQGVKRIQETQPGRFKVLDAIVAAAVIIVDGTPTRVQALGEDGLPTSYRVDIPKNGEFNWSP